MIKVNHHKRVTFAVTKAAYLSQFCTWYSVFCSEIPPNDVIICNSSKMIVLREYNVIFNSKKSNPKAMAIKNIQFLAMRAAGGIFKINVCSFFWYV